MKFTMKWVNANDSLPGHESEVLLCCTGSYCLASFVHSNNHFRMKGGKVFVVGKDEIFWTELIEPKI